MKLECKDGTVIHYRLPNVIEIFELKSSSSFGEDGVNGYGVIAGVLRNCEQFISKIEGKKNWKDCISSRELSDDLSLLAKSLLTDEVEPEEKKPLKSSVKT